MAVTAKVKVQGKHEVLDGTGESFTQLFFNADYDKPENKEWAKFTPNLNFQMSVLNSVAEKFKVGQSFTVTFTAED